MRSKQLIATLALSAILFTGCSLKDQNAIIKVNGKAISKAKYESLIDKSINTSPFGKMGDLLCVSDHVTTMTSLCDICKRDNAIFSFYKGDTKSGDIEIGDSDYIPVCRECYNEIVKKYKS